MADFSPAGSGIHGLAHLRPHLGVQINVSQELDQDSKIPEGAGITIAFLVPVNQCELSFQFTTCQLCSGLISTPMWNQSCTISCWCLQVEAASVSALPHLPPPLTSELDSQLEEAASWLSF